jgi:hypothetical protein
MLTLCIILGILVIITVFVIEYNYHKKEQEKNRWNGGWCPLCGEKLEHFRTDEKGNVGYKCSNILCSYYVWFSEAKEENNGRNIF